jgi:hypothetical protein
LFVWSATGGRKLEGKKEEKKKKLYHDYANT